MTSTEPDQRSDQTDRRRLEPASSEDQTTALQPQMPLHDDEGGAASTTPVFDWLLGALRAIGQSTRWTVGVLVGCHLVVLALFVTPIDAPTVYPDEFSYIAIARHFAGGYPEPSFVDLVYQFGFGAMLAPVAAVFEAPYDFHAAAQWLNILLALTVGPMLFALIRQVFDASVREAGLAAALGVLAPATIVQPALLWAESAFTATTVLAVLLLVRFVDQPSPRRAVLLVASLAWAYAVHPRGIVLSMAVLAVLAVLAFRRRVTVPVSLLTVGSLLALVWTVRRVQAGVAERVFDTGSLPLDAESEWDLILSSAIPNADRWLRGLVGAVWYQGLVTVGLVVVVAWWAMKLLARHWRAPDVESSLAVMLGLAWGAALVVGALVFLGAERRIDHGVYGRYAGHLTPLLLAIGAVLVMRRPAEEARTLRFGVAAVALGAVLTRFAHPSGFWDGAFAVPNATVFGAVGDLLGAREPLRVGLATAILVSIFAIALARRGAIGLAVPALALIAVGFAATVTEIDPRSEWNERNFTFASELPPTEEVGPIVIDDDVEEFITRYGVQYWRPDLEFVTGADATDASQYWIVSGAGRRPTADARLFDANRSFDVRFWIRPGPLAEQLDFQDALYWPDVDLDVRIPRDAMDAELATAGRRAIEIEEGESADLRILVRHLGEDYPWPTGPELIGESVVRLGARWYLDDDEVADARVELAEPVRPGEATATTLELEPIDFEGEPLGPGTYTVRVDLLQEFVFWFGDVGATEPLEFTVTIR